MEERASGIILRTRPLTETSLIVHLVTREHGRIALVAKGARRPKSPYSGKLDLFYEVDLSFSRGRKSELHNLREAILRDLHASIRQDFAKLNAAAYATVLIELGTETETPIPEFYEFIQRALRLLDQVSPGFGFAFGLEFHFLALVGALPDVKHLSSAAQKIAAAFQSLPLEAADKLPLTPILKQELEPFLRRAIGISLERLPPQRERFMATLMLNKVA